MWMWVWVWVVVTRSAVAQPSAPVVPLSAGVFPLRAKRGSGSVGWAKARNAPCPPFEPRRPCRGGLGAISAFMRLWRLSPTASQTGARSRRRSLLCPLPSWERATQRFNKDDRERGTLHTLCLPRVPLSRSEYVECPAMPSPTRGEGTNASAAICDAVGLALRVTT